MTLVSRLLGLVRDIVLARLFGADAGMDAFFVAFKIPNFMRRLFAEGAFSQAFVPVIAEYREQRTHEEVRALAGRVAGTLLGILTETELHGSGLAKRRAQYICPVVAVPGIEVAALQTIQAFESANQIKKSGIIGFELYRKTGRQMAGT